MTAVRVLDGDDWPQWRDLRLRALLDAPSAFGSTHARELAFTEEHWRRRLADPEMVCVMASAGDVPLGMAGGFPDLPGWLHVVAMWVDPGARGRGVGRALLHEIGAWAEPRGLRLHLDVNVANLGARAMYERCGFAGTGETRPLREGSQEVIERMVLDTPRALRQSDSEDIVGS